MDKQSKLIFERYTRRTILEQTSVNNVAPVNIGTPTRTWSQAGQQLQSDIKQGISQITLNIGKFFAENEFGILLNTLDLTPITNIVQLPYLADNYNKQPNAKNATFLVLGGLSVLPYAGQGAEWFSRVTKLTANPTVRQLAQLVPIRDKTFNAENTKQLIKTLQQVVFDNKLMETIANSMPANTRASFLKAREDLVKALNSPETLQALNATNKELDDAFLLASKNRQIPQTNVFGGAPTTSSFIRDKARLGRGLPMEKAAKLNQIIRGLQNVQEVAVNVNQLPAKVVETLGGTVQQMKNIIFTLPGMSSVKPELFTDIQNLINILSKTFNETDNLKNLPDDQLISFLDQIDTSLAKIDNSSTAYFENLKQIILDPKKGKNSEEFLQEMDNIVNNTVSKYNAKLAEFDKQVQAFGKEKLSIDVPSFKNKIASLKQETAGTSTLPKQTTTQLKQKTKKAAKAAGKGGKILWTIATGSTLGMVVVLVVLLGGVGFILQAINGISTFFTGTSVPKAPEGEEEIK